MTAGRTEGESNYFRKYLEEIKKEAPKCTSVRDISGGDGNVMKQVVVEGLYIIIVMAQPSPMIVTLWSRKEDGVVAL